MQVFSLCFISLLIVVCRGDERFQLQTYFHGQCFIEPRRHCTSTALNCATRSHVEVFRLQATTGRGVAMFANKRFVAGDLVLCESPLFIYKKSEMDQIATEILPNLSDAARAAFYELSDAFTPHQLTVLGIAATNNFRARNQSESGMFALGSRINHSCRPNVNYEYLHEQRQLCFHAIREIYADEEILGSYIDLLQSRQARQDMLLERYRFKCSCEACAVTNRTQIEASDRRRKLIAQLFSQTFKKLSVRSKLKRLDRIHEAIGQEKLPLSEYQFELNINYYQALAKLKADYSASRKALRRSKKLLRAAASRPDFKQYAEWAAGNQTFGMREVSNELTEKLNAILSQRTEKI